MYLVLLHVSLERLTPGGPGKGSSDPLKERVITRSDLTAARSHSHGSCGEPGSLGNTEYECFNVGTAGRSEAGFSSAFSAHNGSLWECHHRVSL